MVACYLPKSVFPAGGHSKYGKPLKAAAVGAQGGDGDGHAAGSSMCCNACVHTKFISRQARRGTSMDKMPIRVGEVGAHERKEGTDHVGQQDTISPPNQAVCWQRGCGGREG
eukprot:1157804-Pelagomonas_calceolata.AAC.2